MMFALGAHFANNDALAVKVNLRALINIIRPFKESLNIFRLIAHYIQIGLSQRKVVIWEIKASSVDFNEV